MGTPYWMAPEVISRSLYATEVTTLSSPQSSQKGLGDTWFFYLWSSPELPTKDCPQFLGSRLVSPFHWPLLDGSSLAYDFAATSWPPKCSPPSPRAGRGDGLPLDMDVYDLASWCSICELSERSVRSNSRPQNIPDFTCGGWKSAKPLGIEGIDMAKMDFRKVSAGAAENQMDI